MGSEEFKKEFVTEKVAKWIDELTTLTKIAQTKPHVAYAAYTHCFKHKYAYLLRTIPDISRILGPLDEAVN